MEFVRSRSALATLDRCILPMVNNVKIDNMTKKYCFLTGATGLVGSYVMRNLLTLGHQVAVLVRPSKRQSCQQRIGSLLTHWENETGELLPRPHILEGDLLDHHWVTQYDGWIKEHCDSIIHCAASLTFHGSKTEEPWLSNIEGTRKILSLCESTGIRNMHYVSTAYVAGTSRMFDEDELDAGQSLRNDYEQSKFEAEKMVRAANIFDSLTIYRPSIVVGDSRTAYTSTFHGFYAVLKLAHTLVNRMSLGTTSGRGLLKALGVTDNDRKNYVPVDWAADVMTHIFTNPQWHGRTYHLTTPEPPLLTEFVDVVQDAVETYSTLADEADPLLANESWFFEQYLNEVQIYAPYLQDDPKFDSTNTQTAAPHLPCPKMDKELMMFLARYAILSRFGKTKVNAEPLKPPALTLSTRSANEGEGQRLPILPVADAPG